MNRWLVSSYTKSSTILFTYYLFLGLGEKVNSVGQAVLELVQTGLELQMLGHSLLNAVSQVGASMPGSPLNSCVLRYSRY